MLSLNYISLNTKKNIMKETTFLDKCKGIALIIFASLIGTAAVLFSVSPAQADNGPETTYSTGKYMMTLQATYAEDLMNWYVLVWDTETGRSKFYYGNPDAGMTAASSRYNLPSSPL
jgi:hypothetical protein